MDLVNKEVMHEIFGKGNVINYDDSYIEINFESGDKKFSFPDVFKEYITFIDEKATDLVNKKIEKADEKQRKEDIILRKERALEKQLQYLEKQKKRTKSGKVNSQVQSVFWCESREEEIKIFTEWRVFTGEIKSGKKKGQPRRLARMNQNSACLITRREDDMGEEDRKILGVFMANEFFNGRLSEDGYITAHSKYRLQLSEEESEKMLFWDYYVNKGSGNKTVWNSGRQRYFENMWMAQILKDIVELRDNPEQREEAQAFFGYFCIINSIDQDEIPMANGALKRDETE